jgi:hypothetical protein
MWKEHKPYLLWWSGVWGNLLAGEEVVGVRVLDGDSDEVRTRLRAVSFEVRGSVAFMDQVRLVGDRLRLEFVVLSLKVLGLGDGEKLPTTGGWWFAAAANAAACMYAGSAMSQLIKVVRGKDKAWNGDT